MSSPAVETSRPRSIGYEPPLRSATSSVSSVRSGSSSEPAQRTVSSRSSRARFSTSATGVSSARVGAR